ncbi:hypothetical protein M422DRAFT_65370 [Sphaerobolus stellatus SS14]|nr:hypothetical protein M422DRAFT_65370 [Sphaerobolus stellatus SS14]
MRSLLLFAAANLFVLAYGQSSTSSSSSSSQVSSISPPPATVTSGTTISPTTGTTTLFANGTATATVINGTKTSASTSASTSSSIPFPPLSNVSACVANCLQTSIGFANCSSITDVSCYCESTPFRNDTLNCVSTQCPDQIQSAENLAQKFCALVSVTLTFPPQTVSGSATVSPISVSPTSVSPTSVSPSPTATSPNAGDTLGYSLIMGVLAGLGALTMLFVYY